MAFDLPPVCFMLLFWLPFSTTAQSYRNITLGSSLTANGSNSSWTSPSGDFAFGFKQIGSTGGYLLAIWFNKIPEKTIVWSANRDNLIQQGSTIQLTTDGRFVLSDPTGQQIIPVQSNSTVMASTGVAYAAMLDSGNFVLASNNGSGVLWQSFDNPTDTMLPTQVLSEGNVLVARYSETNYSKGRFGLNLQSDNGGNLYLYTRNFPLDTGISAYGQVYSSLGSGFQLIFNQSGFIYIKAGNGSVLSTVLSSNATTSQFYQRAILEYDGVLRLYVYPKSENSAAGKPMAWSSVSILPPNICVSITQVSGPGACGYNSYCILGSDERPRCECPSGYSLIDPNDEMIGCKQNFVPQNCDPELQEADLFDFVDLNNTNWGTFEYEIYNPVLEDWCREVCLRDCFCSVAIFRNGNCRKIKIPLSNGMSDPSVGGKALLKVRRENSTAKFSNSGPKKKDQTSLLITVSALLGSSVFLNFVLLLSTLLGIFHFSKNKNREMLQPRQVMKLRSFSYKELEEATNGFKDGLGSGTFTKVYKGVLKYEDGNVVAITKLDKMMREGEQEFQAEVSAIGRTNHKNLVRLIGYCKDGQHQLLVYEFMSNGSLASFLCQNPGPNWYRRMQIAFGIARGLYYLHEECSSQIIHCDINPRNVLLDDQFTARIANFRLAKLLKTDQSRATIAIRGTKGYVAPEWFKNMPITAKVDVYSFGILLLELICCRKNIELDVKSKNESILVDWAVDCYREGKAHLLVENDDEAMDDMKRAEKFVMIAIWCIQVDPSLRPTMKKVTHMLEGTVEISVPPDPSSFISSI